VGSSFSEEQNFTYTLTGVADHNFSGSNGMYPNPAKDVIYIETLVDDSETISIYDVRGQLILETSPQNKSIDISSLNEGIYIVHFNVKYSRHVAKLLVR
jgi:hypothetical protein